MKLAWLTDPHLNFAGTLKVEALLAQLRAWAPDALLVSGDLGEAHDLEGWLLQLTYEAKLPVYFVLGNHDFYGSSIAQVRHDVRALCQAHPSLVWLGGLSEPVVLSSRVALVGHDGWGDGRAGDVMGTRVMLNDFVQIQELRGLGRAQLAGRLAALGDEAAAHLGEQAKLALSSSPEVLVVTHVPPFVEAAWYEGHPSDDQWAPFFVCQAVGRALEALMRERPTQRMTVLCGHTHSAGEAWILPNLLVRTGEAVYRHPKLQAPLRWPEAMTGQGGP